MSIEKLTISEKIERVRAASGLSIAAFAELVDVSPSTMKSITSRGSSPGMETVEKIINKYPQYAFFLAGISNSVRNTKQITPDESEKIEWRIIQQLSMVDCELNKCCIKPEWIQEIILLVAEDENNAVMCIATLKAVDDSNELFCIRIGKEDFHFDDKSGKNKLERLRNWLKKIDRKDLIKTAQLYYSNTEVMENFYKSRLVSHNDISKSPKSLNFWLGLSKVFSNWVNDRDLDHSEGGVNF